MVAAAPPAAETSDGPPVLSSATTPAQSVALSAGIEADLIDEVEIIPLPSAEGEGPTAATPTGAADAPITDVDAAGFADATPAPAKRKLMAGADDSLPPARIKPRHSAPAQLASLELPKPVGLVVLRGVINSGAVHGRVPELRRLPQTLTSAAPTLPHASITDV